MSTQATRRRFIEIMPMAGVALFAACSPKSEPPPAAPATTTPSAPASAATGNLPMLDEKEPAAVALGYVEDAARADKIKFKNYVAGSQCSDCGNYLGQSGDPAGACKIFPGKNVAAKGWCSAWIKKA
ncbi:MAG: high-potential iron-sulfur protein [Rhodoferax sp.]|nr:high-potential iron-sulfur protein [Rhodoferax sp.]